MWVLNLKIIFEDLKLGGLSKSTESENSAQ
jgi:hypothetical protein